jgi:S-adenosylmethionine decarboxylase proenzyme
MDSFLTKIDTMSSTCEAISPGKHMICDLHNIRNTELMNSLSGIRDVVDGICDQYAFSVLGKLEHQFSPQGCSLVYLLSESHISVHTFPEKNYIAMDIYTCREYPNNDVYNEIYRHLERVFCANSGAPVIIDRGSSSSVAGSSLGGSSLVGSSSSSSLDDSIHVMSEMFS